MLYSKPPITNLPFTFTSTGYTAPDFSSVPFSMGIRSSYQQTADMQSTINVFGPSNCTDTYTYVKEQKTYVIGYSQQGVQILQGQTIYGGIRNLCASLTRVPEHKDLHGYIYILTNFLNLSASLRVVLQSYTDISTDIYAIPPADLSASMHGWATYDITGGIYGWALRNLGAVVGTHLPSNIQAILNVIEIRDILGSITGDWWHGQTDLSSGVYKIFSRGYIDVSAELHGWAERNLPGYITSIYFRELYASIRSTFCEDLSASIGFIEPVDIQGIIHGFDFRHLQGIINGGFGPGDIQAFINAVIPSDLSAYISVYKGIKIPFDLQGILYGSYSTDLFAYIGGILPINLNAFINGLGTSVDLRAMIIPSTILMRRALQIPLLEYKDMNAAINFMCFTSTYRDLSSYVYAMHKLDLRAFIIGWFGSTADNIGELGAYINCDNYTTQDKITIKYVPEVYKYSRLKLKFSSVNAYTNWDTIQLLFGSYYTRNITATINGILTSKDLKANLTAIWDWNYSELPEYVKPKTHEVFINIERFEDQWRRFVELMFDRDGISPFKYFYVNGSQKVYKVDRSRHWTIWADGYSKVANSMIERVNVRRKFIFKFDDYDTVDEAIRELMERAAYPTSSNLSAYIDGGLPIHKDLNAVLNSKVKHTWVKHLTAWVTPARRDYLNLYGEITAALLNSATDLAASIESIEYTPPIGSDVNFIFKQSNYTPANYDDIDLIWTGVDY